MTTRLRLLAASVAVCLSGVLIAADQQAMFRASVSVVAVDATVTRGRNPVLGLGPQDFQLLDNGVRQAITSVTRGTMPLDITIVLDFSGSAENDFPRFMQSAAGMQRLLRGDDRWRWLGIFMEARELLPMRPAHEPLPSIARPGPVHVTALHDTLFLALVRPGEPERRHLVIVFTDGNDTWSMLDARQLPAITDKADAVLHAVVSGAPPPALSTANHLLGTRAMSEGSVTNTSDERLAQRWRDSQNALFDAARRSGGGTHRLTNRAEAFARIVEDFRTAYVLRYTPSGVDTPGWHDLTVTLAQPGGAAIRARKGYEQR
jgi:hypothetical protein